MSNQLNAINVGLGSQGTCQFKDQTSTHANEELEPILPPSVMHVEVVIIVDELGDVAITELKTQYVISNMLNETKNQFIVDGGCIENVIHPIVKYEGNKI